MNYAILLLPLIGIAGCSPAQFVDNIHRTPDGRFFTNALGRGFPSVTAASTANKIRFDGIYTHRVESTGNVAYWRFWSNGRALARSTSGRAIESRNCAEFDNFANGQMAIWYVDGSSIYLQFLSPSEPYSGDLWVEEGQVSGDGSDIQMMKVSNLSAPFSKPSSFRSGFSFIKLDCLLREPDW